ncbi:hypothetical protein CPB83DRAFT_781727 [Crepidotus variabilis]|uniref:Uncharacterized protein n=1 Tax=Crepidotus variabilis TaxID=179855 RepID=A0A9P6EQN4_9AGAR|nr:hypothetical protein CPB83DRAFT_781727 [Crepidotus variabilis]
MRPHNRNKRSRNNKDHDGDVYMNVQEDHRSDTYARSHGSVDNYRAASTSSRTNYIPERERSTHSHHDEDWHRAAYDHERYPYAEPYPRGDRLDDYDNGHSGGGGWGTIDPPAYSSSRHEWPHPYEHGGAPAYPDPSSWEAPVVDYSGGRNAYVGRWPERETRDIPVDDWVAPTTRNEHGHDRRSDWQQESRRDKNSSQGFQSDSGWGHRRREREWSRETSSQQDYSESRPSVEERQWEPAESWKSSNRTSQQQPSNQQNQQHVQRQNGQRSNGKSKRNRDQNKQRREWRQVDDGDLNKSVFLS